MFDFRINKTLGMIQVVELECFDLLLGRVFGALLLNRAGVPQLTQMEVIRKHDIAEAAKRVCRLVIGRIFPSFP
jgi:hypothetical protein